MRGSGGKDASESYTAMQAVGGGSSQQGPSAQRPGMMGHNLAYGEQAYMGKDYLLMGGGNGMRQSGSMPNLHSNNGMNGGDPSLMTNGVQAQASMNYGMTRNSQGSNGMDQSRMAHMLTTYSHAAGMSNSNMDQGYRQGVDLQQERMMEQNRLLHQSLQGQGNGQMSRGMGSSPPQFVNISLGSDPAGGGGLHGSVTGAPGLNRSATLSKLAKDEHRKKLIQTTIPTTSIYVMIQCIDENNNVFKKQIWRTSQPINLTASMGNPQWMEPFEFSFFPFSNDRENGLLENVEPSRIEFLIYERGTGGARKGRFAVPTGVAPGGQGSGDYDINDYANQQMTEMAAGKEVDDEFAMNDEQIDEIEQIRKSQSNMMRSQSSLNTKAGVTSMMSDGGMWLDGGGGMDLDSSHYSTNWTHCE
jgi:hypothetical protein